MWSKTVVDPSTARAWIVASGEAAQGSTDVWYVDDADREANAVVPVQFGGLVTLDPLHQYGRPVVRAVPTEVVAEQFRASESTETVMDLFDLMVAQVEQALRFELSLARTA